MNCSKSVLIIIVCSLSACSMMPYRNDFACSLKDDYGKCIDVQGAYDEAVTGMDSGAPRLSKKGDQVEPLISGAAAAGSRTGGSEPVASDDALTVALSPGLDEYGAYRSAVYQQMRAMLSAPTTPMLRPAQTVRTLIISYANRQDRTRLYMPRYVFSISEGPQFVMGEYLNRRSELLPESVVTVDQESMTQDRH